MRNRSPRSFTVENKSGGRSQRTFIPHRTSAPAIPRPVVSWPQQVEQQALAVEPRRILPSLIAPEPEQVEPERIPVSEEHSPKQRRGRPPKAKPVAAETVEKPIASATIQVAPAEPTPPAAPRMPIATLKRTVKPSVDLPIGERWKRRLGRWAR